MKSMIKKITVGLMVGGCALSTFADAVSELQAAAEAQITSVLTAVTAICVAGFAITCVFWAVRKMRSGVKSA
jgi:hypothetical protein